MKEAGAQKKKKMLNPQVKESAFNTAGENRARLHD
jgi:hypothetical protein